MTMGEKIRYHRKRIGLNQTELGALLGVNKNAVSKWEVGRVGDIPASRIRKMADLFGVRPSYLIEDDGMAIDPHQIAIDEFFSGMDAPEDKKENLWQEARDYIQFRIKK